MTIYSIDPAHVGNYTIEICVELDNLYNWGKLGETFLNTERKYSPATPPESLIYKDCFKVFLTMESNWVN